MKGLNSSVAVVGKLGPSINSLLVATLTHIYIPSSSSSSRAGSNFGERKAIKRLSR